MDIILILWKYQHSVDIIYIWWIYLHYVDTVRILWILSEFVDTVSICHITSNLVYKKFMLSTVSFWSWILFLVTLQGTYIVMYIVSLTLL